MKKLNIILILFMVSCGSTKDFHTEMYKGQEILVGKIQRSELQKGTYGKWFNENYKDYPIEQETISGIKNLINDYTVNIVMGTWCGDSREQVPALFKVLDAAGFKGNVNMYCVPRKYKDYKPTQIFNLKRVPTIWLSNKDKQLPQFIEYPMQSIEKDLLAMIKGTYHHELDQ